MVLDEGHDAARVGVEVVVDETVVDAVEALPPIIGLLILRHIEFVEEAEIHHRLQIRVAV